MLATANTRKTRERFWKNAGEWTGGEKDDARVTDYRSGASVGGEKDDTKVTDYKPGAPVM